MGTVSIWRTQGLVTAPHTSLMERFMRRVDRVGCRKTMPVLHFQALCVSGTWSKTFVFPFLSNKSFLGICAVTAFISVTDDWGNTHFIVLHNMVDLTSTRELHLSCLIPISIFILWEHHQDCPGRYCCLFYTCRCIIHVRYFPSFYILLLSLSLSLSLSCPLTRLSQFLQLSQLTGAIFQFSPSGVCTEQLNNFSIYMHGGMQYHSHTLSLSCRQTHDEDTVLRKRVAVRFTLEASLRPRLLVISVEIKREEFKSFHTQ